MNGATGIEAGRKDQIVGLFSQAHNLAIGGKYEEALKLFDKIVADVPELAVKTPQINYKRALCLKALGRIHEAEEAIRSCLRTSPHDPKFVEFLSEIQPVLEADSQLNCKSSVEHVQGSEIKSYIASHNSTEASFSAASNVARYCPETCIVFVSYGRPEIAARSYNSLVSAIAPYRDRIRIIISDATDDEQKMMWARSTNADDVILTPRFTPAATSRNLATTLILNKYTPTYLCMVEDDFEYGTEWYPSLVEAAAHLYGVMSPFDLAYGIFSACDHQIPPDRRREDERNNVTAYIFGAVAYQRFVPTSHYLAVMRGWDADLLGISYAQTGGQTFRNVMRGFCGAILRGRLSWPIDVDKSLSTWQAKRAPGPPAHSFNLRDYDVITEKTREAGVYQRDEK